MYVHAHAFGLEHKYATAADAPKRPLQALALLPDPSARPENLPKERHLWNVPIFDVPGFTRGACQSSPHTRIEHLSIERLATNMLGCS